MRVGNPLGTKCCNCHVCILCGFWEMICFIAWGRPESKSGNVWINGIAKIRGEKKWWLSIGNSRQWYSFKQFAIGGIVTEKMKNSRGWIQNYEYCTAAWIFNFFLKVYARYSIDIGHKHHSNIKSISMIKLHFFNIIIWFLARIDQQAEIFHSSLSKQYSNIKSTSIINIHVFQHNNMIFSMDRSASRDLSF